MKQAVLKKGYSLRDGACIPVGSEEHTINFGDKLSDELSGAVLAESG